MPDDPIRRSELLPLIRTQVRERLRGIPAFQALAPGERAAIANATVKAFHYILGGADGTSSPSSVTLAGDTPITRELAGSTPSADPSAVTAGDRFATSGAVAAQQGAEAFADLVSRVNFPRFVAGLIDGVFNAIVTSSIKQMEAYADLVKNVAKTAEQYMRDNVTDNNARDYLADRYPQHLEIDLSRDRPRLAPRQGRDDGEMPDFAGDLGLPNPVTALDDDTVEKTLVPAARRRIAMDRQQLLATMVMMGVNRLVVTNGTIEASCLFELNTRDEVRRRLNEKRTSDFTSETNTKWASRGGYSSGFLGLGGESSRWYTKGDRTDTAEFQVTTTKADDSDAKVDLHAKLAGKVNINFRSDFFPMEKMVDVMQIQRIRERGAIGRTANPADASASTPQPAGRP
jgi:hypothetical protein